MIWRLDPFETVGPLTFGQSRQSVRHQLGSDFRSFKKGSAAIDTDAYYALGVHLYYDDSDQLKDVELFSPADLEVAGVRVLNREIHVVLRELRSLGHASVESYGSHYVADLGVGLFAEDEMVTAAGASCRSHFDELAKRFLSTR